MVGETVTERLVYKDRMENIRRSVEIFRDDSLTQASLNLWTGFGRNNRKLLGIRPAGMEED